MFFNPLKLIILEHALAYPTPSNLNYAWSFGFLSGICIGLQVLTGFFLATQYVASTELAFSAIIRIMQDVPNGWFLRLMHANGSSFLFFCLYIHIFRGLFFRSYLFPQTHVWFSGITIYLCATATAFFGYVLPWGQMSFWAATVITNLITVLPFIGVSVAQWFWGGFTISVPTLLRFFSIHYLLPFIILGLIFLHLVLLHNIGSNNPLGIEILDNLTFHEYYTVKDFFIGIFLFILIIGTVCFFPDLFLEPENLKLADPFVTPAKIVPEWYFLPFYAILRCIPHKVLGVVIMFTAIIIYAFLPFFEAPQNRSSFFIFGAVEFFWIYIIIVVLLGWLATKVVTIKVGIVSFYLVICYFMFFFTWPFLDLLQQNTLLILYWYEYEFEFKTTKTRKWVW